MKFFHPYFHPESFLSRLCQSPPIYVNFLKIYQYLCTIYLICFVKYSSKDCRARYLSIIRISIATTFLRIFAHTSFASYNWRALCGMLYNLLIKGRDYRFCRRIRLDSSKFRSSLCALSMVRNKSTSIA